jgi:hypothetical protein
MAVNQSQVDHIITAASEDDPEVKLQNLEREVDLIKTSIKRLLMDIRERMNELENPFTLAATGGLPDQATPSVDTDAEGAKRSALEAREAALDARESEMDVTKSKHEEEKKKADRQKDTEKSPSPHDAERKMLDEQMLAALRNQILASPPAKTAPPPESPVNEKIRLQKVYKLFKWTHQAVLKFGHNRLEIMLGTYQVMGHISKDSYDEIREVSRLIPANLGEEHEVGPDEFVAELYALNRILSPTDTSLDRDMIDVIMEQRRDLSGSMGGPGEDRIALPRVAVSGKKSSLNKEKDEEWMNLPDRI